MATKSNQSDVSQLGRQVGGDNAAAIAEFVDGRITLALDMLADRLTELVSRQMANVAAAKDEGSSEAAKSANVGTKAVKAADEAVKKADADPTPEKVAVAKDKTEEATKVVTQVESDLAARVGAIEDKVDDHEARIKCLEDEQSANVGEFGMVWGEIHAHAHAIATGNGATTGLRRAGRLALGTFLLGVLLWLLLVLVTSITLASWNFGVGLAAIAAGFVFVIVVMTMKEDVPPSAEAEAEADASAELSIMSDQREHASH